MLLIATSLFTSALLLFLVQPLFARMALPLLGGSAGVWTTCILFFQAALLAGYAYANALTTWLGVRRQTVIHSGVLLLPLLVLPIAIAPGTAPPPPGGAVIWLLGLMTATLGLPFFAVATSAPLLQRWFSHTSHRSSRDPYFLYATSNVGSLAALVAYPFVVEPLLPLRLQSVMWAVGYGLLVCLMLASAVVVWKAQGPGAGVDEDDPVSSAAPAPPIAMARKLEWLALSFAPSSLMLGVTTYLSTDIAAVPLLWIVPLALYLVTFIISFGGHDGLVREIAQRAVPPLVLPLAALMATGASAQLWFMIPLHLAAFFAVATGCHARLAGDRPPPRYLTNFFLWTAAGGALGGLFNSLIAPRLFTTITEYPLVITLGCALLAPRPEWSAVGRRPSALVTPVMAGALAAGAIVLDERLAFGVPILLALAPAMLVCFSVSHQFVRFACGIGLILLVGLLRPDAAGTVLDAERTFYGAYRVIVDPGGQFHSLYHGTTLHGRESLEAATRLEPLTYYHRNGPIGQVIAGRQQDGRLMRAAVVGLGAGSLAGYARRGEHWRFYEIDPAVERMARDTRFFQYLSSCGARCDVVLGDARLSLGHERDTRYDLIVLDAFSSDAIPVHLLTREAARIYLDRLAPGGLLVFHISNRHLTLRQVLAALVRDLGLVGLDRIDLTTGTDPAAPMSSEWMVMARQRADLGALTDDPRWTQPDIGNAVGWTDDFSNVLGVLKWR